MPRHGCSPTGGDGMARGSDLARKDRGGDHDPGYCLFGAKTLIGHVQAFEEEIDGVRVAKDIEYVHRMRVATRRIRETLPLFDGCFSKKDSDKWETGIRGMTRALGEARDTDVQIDFLRSFLSGLDIEEYPALGGGQLFLLEDRTVGTGSTVPRASAGEGPEAPGNLSGMVRRVIRRVRRWQSLLPKTREEPEFLPVVADRPVHAPLRIGIECVLLRLQQRRRSLQPAVISALETLRKEGIPAEMQEACRSRIVNARLHHTDVHSLPAYQRSFFHISLRLEELFAFEPFVPMPGQIKEHHAMRIAAKRLRYTMEIFNDLYGDGLKKIIKSTKKLQDLLGDMHDCDVWIEFLPQFLEEERRRAISYFGHAGFSGLIEPGVVTLRKDRMQRRSELYRQFVSHWKEMGDTGTWDELRAVISKPLQSSVQGSLVQLAGEIEEGFVQLALTGDVHANLPALEAVIADAQTRGATAIIHTGDAVGYGAEPNKVLRLMRDRNVISVAGNYDLEVIRAGRGRKKKRKDRWGIKRWTYKRLSKEDRAYLSSLPREVRLMIARKRILVTHGSPASITEKVDQNTPLERLRELSRAAQADIIVSGHAHMPFAREVDGVWFINTGSVGRPGDGDPRACYALLQLDPVSIWHLRIPYDVQAEVDAVLDAGLPPVVAEMFRSGLGLDEMEKAAHKEEDEQAKTTYKVINAGPAGGDGGNEG